MRKQSMGRNIGAHGGIRVLLVDDSLLFLQAATFFLHQEPGVQVVGALCRGERLMSEALSLRPQIVVMDPGVAGLAGMQLIFATIF